MPAMYMAIKNSQKRKGKSDKEAKEIAARTYIARSKDTSAAAKRLQTDRYKGE